MAVVALTADQTSGTSLSAQHGALTGGLFAKINEIITLANANETALAGASDPFNLAGSISLPADFPTTAAVDTGDVYRIIVSVVDSDGTKTNTSQEFLAGSEIVWNGTNWTEFGPGAGKVEATAAIDMKVAGANVLTLNGNVGNQFIPKELVFVGLTASALNGDIELTVGTSVGGTELLPITPLTGLNTVGEKFVIPMTGLMPAILGNAALDITVTTADTGTTGTMSAYIRGEEV